MHYCLAAISGARLFPIAIGRMRPVGQCVSHAYTAQKLLCEWVTDFQAEFQPFSVLSVRDQ
jgi:hypothetical protein